MGYLAERKDSTGTRVVPYVLLSFAASSGIGYYEDHDGVRRFDVVTGQNELQTSVLEESSRGLEFDLIRTREAFESTEELVSFVRTEYLRDKKNIYYTILLTNEQLDDSGRLAILEFLNDHTLTKIKVSPGLLPTLNEIADRRLAEAVRQLAKKSVLTNVRECLSTELEHLFRKPIEGPAANAADVVGYYVRFVESVKRRMGPQQVPEKREEPMKTSVAEQATIGKSLMIKGEVTGSESLYIDGRVEGSITLEGSRVTIGRNAVVSANIKAREIVVLGKVMGNLTASDRIDIRREGSLTGDVVAARISIEDGSVFKGGIDIRKSMTPASHIVQEKPTEAVRESLLSARKF